MRPIQIYVQMVSVEKVERKDKFMFNVGLDCFDVKCVMI